MDLTKFETIKTKSTENKTRQMVSDISIQYVLVGCRKIKSDKILKKTPHQTKMCFANFLSGGFITALVVNPLERKLAKCIFVCTREITRLDIMAYLDPASNSGSKP